MRTYGKFAHGPPIQSHGASRISSSILRQQRGIPYDLPQMLISVLKITAVTTPKGFLSRLYYDRACLPCLLHDRIDFRSGPDVMSECELRAAWAAERNFRIVGNALAGPNRQF